MWLRSSSWCLALALGLSTPITYAQPMEPLTLPASARSGELPSAPGTGADAMAVLTFFRGFPYDIRDARDIIDGRSLAPAFDVWCGPVPYVDFTNGTVRDSLGREAPTALCLPFIDPERMMPAHTCAPAPDVVTGRYYQGGGLVIRFQGSLALRAAGEHTLAWGHDDGFSFRFGDTDVFEFPGPTGSRVDGRVVRVAEPGLYPFTLEWYDTGGGALVDWYIASGDASTSSDASTGMFDMSRFHLVPTDDLYPSELSPCTERCERCQGATSVCDRSVRRCVQCITDRHCPACETCVGQRCLPVAEVPGADGGAGCAPDVAVDAPTVDSSTPDGESGKPDVGAFDVPTMPPPGPGPAGCSCGVGVVPWRSRDFLWMLGLGLAFVYRYGGPLERRPRRPTR